MRNPANRDGQRRTISSSVWLHVLLLVGLWSVALLPVSVVSVFAAYALGILYMLLALTAAVGGEVRILPSAAVAIGVCLLVFMSYSFATGLSQRELDARLAAGRAELAAVASAMRDYRDKKGQFPGPGDWTAKLTEGEECLWVSKVYGVPLLYQNRASSEQAMPCSSDSLSCLELAPDVYLWSPGVLLDARELQRRSIVSLIGRIVLWAMAGLFALCLLALLGFPGLGRPQSGQVAIGLVLAGVVACVLLVTGPLFLGYHNPGREPLQYRIERFDWYWVREHLRRDLVSYERKLVRDYANTGLLTQPALGEVQKVLDHPETLPATFSPRRLSVADTPTRLGNLLLGCRRVSYAVDTTSFLQTT